MDRSRKKLATSFIVSSFCLLIVFSAVSVEMIPMYFLYFSFFSMNNLHMHVLFFYYYENTDLKKGEHTLHCIAVCPQF